MPRLLTILTMLLVVGGFAFNLGELLYGQRRLTSAFIYWAATEWPMAVFAIGLLYGANAMEWIKEHPWAALLAMACLSHCFWPIR